MLWLPLQIAAANTYVEGVDYVKIAGIPESKTPVVREFFSYNCGHCYRQDPFFEQTAHLLGDDVSFERTPVGAGRTSWILSQEAYYLAQKFSVTKQVHGNIFSRIHEKEGAFTRPEQLKDFFVSQGLDGKDVEAAMNSADAKLALMNYDTQAQLAEIRGVPSIVVNGKYLVKNPGKTPEDLVKLVKYLNSLPE
ncbi:thiol:disulfide interchange protein DsbA/DsbL [Shewanella fidelis]|uniref:Thiol:disulfide interchange protein n=2 Tax=Shewanella fidelis TaxID=173509 RepID=A0AAW8NKY8_9GAMM|nr:MULTISPECIES: thiol:disulfide interchange protein DsbA/DsbL [Shewanella]MDR8523435.1 thiol:disulfide interchange protein DsbA/DsbL [Shewanella fidelis]MDW4813331.1 thiol:disulfide interchange protein DsbA/DsbL [Shewanella fidelis]MDW4817297.1 thiol:disulfide interchange protein DsbA/DsbL [Shewanella fidelis]MDW4821346.1 thiol:disulfide interchange protein DsbA/DsbL [Shewanella fidelis]MDW4824576.1 thiol:disulfide interchange protein DsbA/DsbL [Shewanella fidelis]